MGRRGKERRGRLEKGGKRGEKDKQWKTEGKGRRGEDK